MNVFFISLCSTSVAYFFIYLIYQNNKMIRLLEGQEKELKELTEEMNHFIDDTEASFGSVEREIESAKNEILLIANKKEVESLCDREKNTKKLFKNLITAFSASTSQSRDDD